MTVVLNEKYDIKLNKEKETDASSCDYQLDIQQPYLQGHSMMQIARGTYLNMLRSTTIEKMFLFEL